MSFFGELRRRNVFRIGIAYLATVWVLIQVADTVLPVLNAEPWILQALVFSAALGFPLAILLAWFYELTPEGIKVTADVGTIETAKFTGRKVDFAIIGLLVIAVGFLLVRSPPGDRVSVLPNSVAVLPLSNLSPDPDNAYFAIGLHDEILNQLAKLAALSVISRTSVLRYENSELSIPEIAAELNVGTIMEGSVRYSNDRVRITTQLIDAETDEHLWSETYDREFADIFSIESDIAMNIANALEAEFSSVEQQSIEAVPTTSPEAYTLYLRALSLGVDGVYLANEYLDSAIDLDPNFALAYARKALTYANILGGNVPDQQAELEEAVQTNAERALALDPGMAWAHAALASVHQAHWRWAEAEQSFEQALRLSPNDASVLGQYSRLKRFRGEFDTAIEVALRAAELDPQSLLNHYFLGICYRYARNYDAAAEAFQAALDLSPTYSFGHAQLAFAEVSRGNWTDAERELQIAEQLYGDDIQAIRIPQLANAYAQMGRRDEVERLFAALEMQAQDGLVNAAVWALMYIALEDYDQALEWLEVAVDDEAPDLVTLGEIKGNLYTIPTLEEPRFQELRERIGT